MTPPQGHQNDPRVKSLLAFCSSRHPHQFDMPDDYVQNKNLSPGHHSALTPIAEAWPRLQNEKPVPYVLYILFVRTNKAFGKTL